MLDFSQSKLRLGRPLTSYGKVRSGIGAIIRNRPAFAKKKHGGCYLDIGCGPNVDPEFCNLDYSWRPGIDVCWDVTRGLPFPDGSIHGIFTEHMLEHIPFESTLFVLQECRRVLRKGGALRVIMPNGELYLREYAKGEGARMPYAAGDAERFPFVTPMISINRIFREHGHCFIWDFTTLRIALLRAGFETVESCRFREGRDKVLLRDSEERKVESLYAEAH